MNKDGRNLSKWRFGCCFCRSFDNFKNLILYFGTYGLFMGREKVEIVLFLIRNKAKRFVIHHLESPPWFYQSRQ